MSNNQPKSSGGRRLSPWIIGVICGFVIARVGNHLAAKGTISQGQWLAIQVIGVVVCIITALVIEVRRYRKRP